MYTYLQKLIITPKFRSHNSILRQAMTAFPFNFVRYKTRALLPTVRYGPISRVSVHRKVRKAKRNRTLKWPKGSMNLLGNHSVRPLGVTPYASNETERASYTQLPVRNQIDNIPNGKRINSSRNQFPPCTRGRRLPLATSCPVGVAIWRYLW